MRNTTACASLEAESELAETVERIVPLILRMSDDDKDILEWKAKGKTDLELSKHFGFMRNFTGRYGTLCRELGISSNYTAQEYSTLIEKAMLVVAEREL